MSVDVPVNSALTVRSASVSGWTEALAEAAPNPGGGSAGAVVLGFAAALIEMVCGYSVGRGSDDEVSALAQDAAALRRTALRLVDEDGEASARLAAAYRSEPGPDRDRRIREESVRAAETCAEMASGAIAVLPGLARLADLANPALIADVVVAGDMLRTALATSRTNIGVDLGGLIEAGASAEELARSHPEPYRMLSATTEAIHRIDAMQRALESRVLPTLDGE